MKKLTINDYGFISETMIDSGKITYQHKKETPRFILRDKHWRALGVIDLNVFDYLMFDNFDIDSMSKNTNVINWQYYKHNVCFIDTLNKKTLRDILNV
jgi:hypothetical protein